jgi:(p)ppGpp synthase/HD superfamily hydrolase
MSIDDRLGPDPALGERFAAALVRAVELHRGQTRKGGRIPYLGHLLGVASLVVDAGGTEDQAIAALLHDALEDQPDLTSAPAISAEFGPDVARIVLGCSDVTPDTMVGGRKPPWLERKRAYLAHLEHVDDDVLLVSLADKLHNARSLRLDVEEAGESVWARFNAGPEQQLWYYHRLVEVFGRRVVAGLPRRLVHELRREVDAIAEHVPGRGVEELDGG